MLTIKKMYSFVWKPKVASCYLAALAASFFIPCLDARELGEDSTAESHFQLRSQAKVHYMLQCQGCHLASGKGTASGVPDMTQYGALLLKQDRGRKFFIQVPGVSNAALDDEQLAEVLNYIVDDILKAEGVAYFTAEEIALSRGRPIDNIVSYHAKLIETLAKP